MAVLLQTAMVLLATLPPELVMSGVALVLLLTQLFVCIYTMSTLFSLGKALREPQI